MPPSRRRHLDELGPGDVAVCGVPLDVNSSHRRGAAGAPGAVRRALWSDRTNRCTEWGLDLEADERFVDLGDLAPPEGGWHPDSVASAFAALVATGARPLVVGGDHSITWPVLAGRARARPDERPVLVGVDAHPDLYESLDGNPWSHASPMARIAENGLASAIVTVGVRTTTDHQRRQARRHGVRLVPAAAFDARRVPIPPGPVWLTVDLDGLDPAHAPGVAHPEPGGLTVRQVLDLVDRIGDRLVGADIVECNPGLDVRGLTAAVAAELLVDVAGRLLVGAAGTEPPGRAGDTDAPHPAGEPTA
ncbi:MAG: agmatinase [Actinomyces sp.]|nr:MAG: agmatinase [Actinomyces sp.]